MHPAPKQNRGSVAEVAGGAEQDPSRLHQDWHALSAEQTLRQLGLESADGRGGLAGDEIDRRRMLYGLNALPEPERSSGLAVFLNQFKSPLIYLLFGAAALALALGEVSDAAVIFVVVLVNACIGAVQEGRAARALAALVRISGQSARVERDGRETVIDARDVVPGDLLLIAAGDAVAADARVLEAAALQIAEAALTGESVPVGKDPRVLAESTALAERTNMLFAGTAATTGRARAIVVATGAATEIGKVAALAEAAEAPKTPLERRIEHFGRQVMVAAGCIFGVIVAIGWLRGLPLGELLMVGLSQVVGMVPEGLPVAMTIALAVGVQRMARRRAIVRRLSAVETLGCTTVICSDKTGTLTRNEMTVTTLWLPEREEVSVRGGGYAPEGDFLDGERILTPASEPSFLALIEAVVLCNDADLQPPAPGTQEWRPIGDPTEVALITLGRKAGLSPDALRRDHPRTAEIPFDSGVKMMATQHAGNAGPLIVVKGAPEALLGLCGWMRTGAAEPRPFDDDAREQARATANRMASRALRVLAVAVLREDEPLGGDFARLQGRLTLLGMVGQTDPPRPEVKEAVRSCRAAGIRPVMVTGDHKATGTAVAVELGIARPGDRAVDGEELAQMSDVELQRDLDSIAVFARVHPAQKLRIVEAYQQRQDVVAMTGDGVNDAPALVRADVGVAMGVTGTEVAKEAAKIVVTDDNFATIVAAIEEGRVVYRNIKKAVLFLLATSLAEVLVLLLAVALGYPPPFAAVQILWNNLVTEGVVTLNLVMDPAEGEEMRQRPISPHEPLLGRALLSRMLVMTPAIVVATLGWFVYRIHDGAAWTTAQSESFTLLAVCEWFNALNCRSETHSALNLSLVRNPWLIGGLLAGNVLQIAVIYAPPLNAVFHTEPIDLEHALAIGVLGSLVLWVEELRKFVVRHRSRRGYARAEPQAAS